MNDFTIIELLDNIDIDLYLFLLAEYIAAQFVQDPNHSADMTEGSQAQPTMVIGPGNTFQH